jgi:hypothetical protein
MAATEKGPPDSSSEAAAMGRLSCVSTRCLPVAVPLGDDLHRMEVVPLHLAVGDCAVAPGGRASLCALIRGLRMNLDPTEIPMLDKLYVPSESQTHYEKDRQTVFIVQCM